MTQTQTISLARPHSRSPIIQPSASDLQPQHHEAECSPIAEHAITLRGSAVIVSEFFVLAIQSILYQRAVYDPTIFTRLQRWGVTVQSTIDPALSSYLQKVAKQVEIWLARGDIKKLVMVIASVDDNEVLERWVFDIETNPEAAVAAQFISSSDNENQENSINTADTTSKTSKQTKAHKTEGQIAKEIAAVMRQITSCVSFLPLLDAVCSFDLLVYTSTDLMTPLQWEETDARLIENGHAVKLRSFNTGLQEIGTTVTYKQDEL